jgi:hypothetical protein
MSSKKSAIFNYIPHKRQIEDDNFQEWYEHYKEHLLNMYLGTNKLIDDAIRDKIFDWNSEEKFNLFVNFIYDSSSRHIKQ